MTTKAIVIGASMAGLATARVLSEHVDVVEIVERDELDDTFEPRRGVPQGRHAHAILAAGQQLLVSWFPGIDDELVDRGAAQLDGLGAWWYQAGAFRTRFDIGTLALSASRPLLEGSVRRRVAAIPNVSIRDGVSVDGLSIAGDRVVGVFVDGRASRADLVVDCAGRRTRLLRDIVDAGFPTPPESVVHIDMAYGTKVLRRRPDDLDGTFAIVAPTPPHENRFGVLIPIEDDRWILTLGGIHGDAPPTDDREFLEFAASLPTPVIADILARAESLTPVMSYRLPSSQRRHFERLTKLPRGYVTLGDAVCSFNPAYGQGMSSAALQADALDRVLERYDVDSHGMARAFYKRAAKVVDNPWTIAVGADFVHPATTGPKPPGTDLINRYIRKVILATHTSPRVAAQMMHVQNLLAPPQSLMSPAIMVRALRAARRSPAVTGAVQQTPVVGPALASPVPAT